jgi:solute carrier family 9 (sodium/hydrogen exchanger), member 6/7
MYSHIVPYLRIATKYDVARTLSKFHGTEVYVQSLFHGIGIFLLTFTVSMALGVSFGLAMSLTLKHSSLSHFPRLESCLVALCAYTCYFFSNGITMSGIVSLLFCGMTLKHYAYHTMSRRTQRTSKYIFATLAQLSENFIFVYLGLSLFTSAPPSTKVTSYFKPIFVTITTVCVIFTRYAAVFPLSEAINFFHRHARGQRTDELPHSYQMMLFWAGLRGAVGVALAAGFQGENAETLRITVLVVVVLTVVLFGGTTARMLEVLGIRTGVEDEAASSDDEEEPVLGRGAPWMRRRGQRTWYADEDDGESYFAAQQQTPRAPRTSGNGHRVGVHYPTPRSYNHHAQGHGHGQGSRARTDSPGAAAREAAFSAASSDSYDSDGGEVLPLASAGEAPSRRAHVPAPEQDGKWFQALDERYLIPLFSNATASRTFHAKKAQRRSAMYGAGVGSGVATPIEGASEDEGEGQEIDLTAVAGVAERFARGEGSRGGSGLASPRAISRTPSRTGMQSMSLEESRAERGLASPMLRSNGGQGDGGGQQHS